MLEQFFSGGFYIFLLVSSCLQLESLRVPFLSVEDLPADLSTEFDILLDAVFGFSFHGNYFDIPKFKD